MNILMKNKKVGIKEFFDTIQNKKKGKSKSNTLLERIGLYK